MKEAGGDISSSKLRRKKIKRACLVLDDAISTLTSVSREQKSDLNIKKTLIIVVTVVPRMNIRATE